MGGGGGSRAGYRLAQKCAKAAPAAEVSRGDFSQGIAFSRVTGSAGGADPCFPGFYHGEIRLRDSTRKRLPYAALRDILKRHAPLSAVAPGEKWPGDRSPLVLEK